MTNNKVTEYLPEGKTWLRAIVTSIPVVGGALDHLLFDKADSIRARNIEAVLEAFSERLNQLKESAIDKNWFQSEEALAVMRLLTDKISFEPNKQKIVDLGKISATCGMHKHSNDEKKLSVLEHLSRLSPVQLRLLQVMDGITPQSRKLNGDSLEQTITALWPDSIKASLSSRPAFWNGTLNIILELEVLESLNTVRRAPIIVSGELAYTLTSLGKQAASYVTDANL